MKEMMVVMMMIRYKVVLKVEVWVDKDLREQ
jgi:hypothetical protein